MHKCTLVHWSMVAHMNISSFLDILDETWWLGGSVMYSVYINVLLTDLVSYWSRVTY